jgi:hypothetical protein
VFEGGGKDAGEMRNWLFACLLFSYSLVVEAAQLASIKVVHDKVDAQNSQCGINSIANIAAVESIFRQNRISITSDSDVSAHIRVESIKDSVGCFTTIMFQVYFLTIAKIPRTSSQVLVVAELCEQGVLLTGASGNMQSRVADKLRSFAEICISEVEKK